MKTYAGIGSRETPADVLDLMYVAGVFFGRSYILRTGGAQGADSAFLQGCVTVDGLAELYLPWRGFNNIRADMLPECVEIIDEPTADAYAIAEQHHPNWRSMGRGARRLHARNTHQILGRDCHTPVDFVLCWTVDASGAGGTGQAIRIAQAHGIRVLDLGDPRVLAAVKRRIGS